MPSATRRLDYDLPLALLFAREASLLPLKAQLRKLGISENAFRLARAVALAGAPITQAEAARRSGVMLCNVRRMATRLVAGNMLAWERGKRTFSFRTLTATSWGARQLSVLARRLAQPDMGDWPALAQRGEASFTAPMRAALWRRLVVLQRAAEREAVLDSVNEPVALDGELRIELPLQLTRTRAALLARIRRPLRAHGLSEVQWRVLRILNEDADAGWPVMALYVRGCFHKGTTVPPVLRALKRRGLVMPKGPAWPTKRGKIPKRRQVQISPTGRATIAAAERDIRAACADLLARLDAEQMEELRWLLQRLTLALLWRRDLHVLCRDQPYHPFAEAYARNDAKRMPRDKVLTARRRSRLYAQGILKRPRKFSRWHEAR